MALRTGAFSIELVAWNDLSVCTPAQPLVSLHMWRPRNPAASRLAKGRRCATQQSGQRAYTKGRKALSGQAPRCGVLLDFSSSRLFPLRPNPHFKLADQESEPRPSLGRTHFAAPHATHGLPRHNGRRRAAPPQAAMRGCPQRYPPTALWIRSADSV
eukprot:scaffold113134_cov28-Tisochrysis_lutea.AAC.2